MRRGVIAVGSNSTRLLIADCDESGIAVVCRARRGTRLLSHMENGVITPEGVAGATADIAALNAEARDRGAEIVDLIATSASRDAKNGGALAARVLEETGLSLRIVSGEEEARLAYLAAAGGESAVVIDIGGGSTEITAGGNGTILTAGSARVGSSRLLSEFGGIDAYDRALIVRDAAYERLRPLARRTGAVGARALYAIGGTAVAAARIQTRDAGAEDVAVSRAEIDRQLRLIAPMTLPQRAALPGMPVSRAAHMPHGLCILSAAMDALSAERLTVSERTNADGFLLDLIKNAR